MSVAVNTVGFLTGRARCHVPVKSRSTAAAVTARRGALAGPTLRTPRARAAVRARSTADDVGVDENLAFAHVEDIMTTIRLRCARNSSPSPAPRCTTDTTPAVSPGRPPDRPHRPPARRTCAPDEKVGDVLSLMDHVHGLPVVDADGLVVGVISRVDADAWDNVEARAVAEVMKTPPITVRARARVADAVALMMDHDVHRLPVVDAGGKLVGIVSRSDCASTAAEDADLAVLEYASGKGKPFAALESVPERSWTPTDHFTDKTSDPLAGAAAGGDGAGWEVKYLFDGECAICRNLKKTLEQADSEGKVKFVDISSKSYRAQEHQGITYEQAMTKIHAVSRDGTVFAGQEALNELYAAVGWGWVNDVTTKVPGLGWLAGKAVDTVSALRLPMGGKTLAGLAAMKRAQQEQDGTAECDHDPTVECEADLDFDDVPDLAELARLERGAED